MSLLAEWMRANPPSKVKSETEMRAAAVNSPGGEDRSQLQQSRLQSSSTRGSGPLPPGPGFGGPLRPDVPTLLQTPHLSGLAVPPQAFPSPPHPRQHRGAGSLGTHGLRAGLLVSTHLSPWNLPGQCPAPPCAPSLVSSPR